MTGNESNDNVYESIYAKLASYVSFDNTYESGFKKRDKQESVYIDVPQWTHLTEDNFPTSFHSQLPKSLPSLEGKYMQIIIMSNDKTQK